MWEHSQQSRFARCGIRFRVHGGEGMRFGGFLHVTTFWHNFVVPDISRNFSGFAGDSQKGWHNMVLQFVPRFVQSSWSTDGCRKKAGTTKLCQSFELRQSALFFCTTIFETSNFCRCFRSFMAENSVRQAPDLQLYDVCYCFPSFHVV